MSVSLTPEHIRWLITLSGKNKKKQWIFFLFIPNMNMPQTGILFRPRPQSHFSVSLPGYQHCHSPCPPKTDSRVILNVTVSRWVSHYRTVPLPTMPLPFWDNSTYLSKHSSHDDFSVMPLKNKKTKKPYSFLVEIEKLHPGGPGWGQKGHQRLEPWQLASPSRQNLSATSLSYSVRIKGNEGIVNKRFVG